MKSKHTLHQEDKKEDPCYHNFPAFQELYFLVVFQSNATRPTNQTLSIRGKENLGFFFSELVWALQTHGSLQDNFLYRVTYQAEIGAFKFCSKSTSAGKNKVRGQNKVESTSLDGYFLSALF